MNVVGIRIEGSSKIYYYLTDKHYTVGQQIKIVSPSGGTPDAVVVEVNSRVRFAHMKYLKEAS